MNRYAQTIAAVLAAFLAVPVAAADPNAKSMMRSADDVYRMAKRQARSEEKAALAQCGVLAGEAKSQCKRNAEASYKMAMADADAAHDKSRAEYKGTR